MNAVLVHYILEGEGVLTGEDGVTVQFGPDTLIFLPRDTAHDLSESGDQEQVLVWKYIATPLGDGMMRLRTGAEPHIVSACGTLSADCEGLDLFAQLREPVVEEMSGLVSVRLAFESLLEELCQPRFGTKPLVEALMKQCLILAVRKQVERGELNLLPLAGSDPRLVRSLLNLMEDPAREHTVDELASASGMSRSLFAERFTEAFERPPMDLLKQIRLHRAAALLRSTNLPVQVIGLAVGYASRSYFSRAFRAAYGRDPKNFRDEARAAGAQNKET